MRRNSTNAQTTDQSDHARQQAQGRSESTRQALNWHQDGTGETAGPPSIRRATGPGNGLPLTGGNGRRPGAALRPAASSLSPSAPHQITRRPNVAGIDITAHSSIVPETTSAAARGYRPAVRLAEDRLSHAGVASDGRRRRSDESQPDFGAKGPPRPLPVLGPRSRRRAVHPGVAPRP